MTDSLWLVILDCEVQRNPKGNEAIRVILIAYNSLKVSAWRNIRNFGLLQFSTSSFFLTPRISNSGLLGYYASQISLNPLLSPKPACNLAFAPQKLAQNLVETRLNPLPHPEVLPSCIAQIFLNDYGRPAVMIFLLQLGGVKRQQLELGSGFGYWGHIKETTLTDSSELRSITQLPSTVKSSAQLRLS
jgi:hypothetical protein